MFGGPRHGSVAAFFWERYACCPPGPFPFSIHALIGFTLLDEPSGKPMAENKLGCFRRKQPSLLKTLPSFPA